MTILITIAIILLFGLCVYIESYYRHTVHKTAREKDEPTKSSKYYHWGDDITIGFLVTISKWLIVLVSITILDVLMKEFKNIEPILYEDYKTLWRILTLIISIAILWYFYLETLIKRSKQINFGNQKHSLGFKFAPKNSLIFMLWILFLMIVPYVTMNVTHDAISPLDYFISPDQYESHNTIMSQILQEVANTNAAVRSEIRYFADHLYKTMLTGITSSTVVLGLLIFFVPANQKKANKLTVYGSNRTNLYTGIFRRIRHYGINHRHSVVHHRIYVLKTKIPQNDFDERCPGRNPDFALEKKEPCNTTLYY